MSCEQASRMDVRQVALGAVFGAAVAVNAALQSLQDSGSFLVRGPSSDSVSSSPPLPHAISLPSPRPRKRAFIQSSAAEVDFPQEEPSFFRAFLNDEELDAGGVCEAASESEEQLLPPFSANTPSVDNSAGYFQEDLTVFETSSFEAHHGPKKLQVKRKIVEASPKATYKAEYYLKSGDEENSSTEDGDVEWESSNSLMNEHVPKKGKFQRPVFMSLLPQMVQSEEATSAMLQHTNRTVLETLTEARERREQMLEDMKRVSLPEEETSLELMSRFIDALINVSDSLQIVHSALFSRTDDPQSRS